MTKRLEEILPNAEQVEIANASHILHEDNPEQFTASILPFLKQHRLEV